MARRRRRAPNNLPRPWHWTDDARCRDQDDPNTPDPDTFYAENDAGIIAAKLFCEPCAVREHCLTAALDRREPAGVWGGLSTDERKAILAPVIAAERRAAAERRRQAEEQAAAQAADLQHLAQEVEHALAAAAA